MVASSSLTQETATTFPVGMGVEISFVLSGFMFHPLTLISLKIPDFNIHITMSMRKPQIQKKKAPGHPASSPPNPSPLIENQPISTENVNIS